MERENILRQYLKKVNYGKSTLKIKKLEGSSSASVFTCGKKIYKVGPMTEAKKEILTYQKFRERLTDYAEIFPNISILMSVNDVAIWEIEFIGSINYENVLLSLGTANPMKWLEIIRLNDEILKKIGILHNSTKDKSAIRTVQEQAKGFFYEINDAIQLNFEKAEITNNKAHQILKKIRVLPKVFLKNFIPSIAHKDLSVGNIIVEDKRKTVRFIDPRPAVPYLELSNADGNVVVDLVGYYVSVLRKELELKKRNRNISLKLIRTKISQRMRDYENVAFVPIIKDLCFLFWYSVYSACKCDYCTSTERLWLYRIMKKRIYYYLSKLNKNLN